MSFLFHLCMPVSKEREKAFNLVTTYLQSDTEHLCHPTPAKSALRGQELEETSAFSPQPVMSKHHTL